MSRERQKANRKLKQYALSHDGQLPEGAFFTKGKTGRSTTVTHVDDNTSEKPWLNPEGYYDLTTYEAIRNTEKERKE